MNILDFGILKKSKLMLMDKVLVCERIGVAVIGPEVPHTYSFSSY